jgi:hypothetical protein
VSDDTRFETRRQPPTLLYPVACQITTTFVMMLPEAKSCSGFGVWTLSGMPLAFVSVLHERQLGAGCSLQTAANGVLAQTVV